MKTKTEEKYWKDKAIILQNMLVDISNIIEITRNTDKQIIKIKKVYKENEWDI